MRIYGLLTVGNDPFPLKSISVKAATAGPIAQNTIEFRYKNQKSSAVDAKFVFPINSESAVYHLEARIGSRKIVAKIKEKKQAEKEFNDAKKAGKTAVLAKEADEASDIMELELGNLDKNEDALITIKEVFDMPLVKRGTCFRYKFPTSLFVRYGENTVTSGQAGSDSQTPSPFGPYHLNFELNDNMESAVEKIKQV